MALRRLGIIALLVPLGTMSGCGCGASKADVQKMRRMLDGQLPNGSSQSQVVKFLEEKHISPGKLVDAEDPKHRGLRQLGATATNFLGSEPTMWIEFYFDGSGILVDSTITNSCGPPDGY